MLQLYGLAKQVDMTERQVERWWRLRRSQDKPSTLVKFCENMWRFTFYLYNFSYGLFILWDKEWLWDIDYCYIGYPHQVRNFRLYFFESLASKARPTKGLLKLTTRCFTLLSFCIKKKSLFSRWMVRYEQHKTGRYSDLSGRAMPSSGDFRLE